LATAGSRIDPETEPRTTIVDVEFTDESGEVNSVKVGFVAYTYETGIINGRRCINGIQLNDEQLACYNSYLSYNGDEMLNQSLEEIKKEIEYSQANADITIVYMHWGEEYYLKANAQQLYVSKYLAELKPDAIVGSHSHTVQPITEIDGVPVFYSLGNYISNQRQETLSGFHPNAHYTEQFIIGCLDFRLVKEFDEAGNPMPWQLESVKASAIPGWIDKYTAGGKVHYAAIPLTDGFEETEELKTRGHTQRAKSALEDIKKIVGEDYLRLE
ncbi:MAG: CapA family protein, partial [Firmicutes bacterium]|nr:CapA family protein [Bacillota bacterium]